MDIVEYRNLLDDRFLFFFSSGDEQLLRADNLISTENMFSGENRVNSHGVQTRAIFDINIDHFQLQGTWSDIDQAHPTFGSTAGVMQSLYQVRIVMNLESGTITIDSNQIFYAVPSTIDGMTHWALIGQEDVTLKGNEDMSWGMVKSFYR